MFGPLVANDKAIVSQVEIRAICPLGKPEAKGSEGKIMAKKPTLKIISSGKKKSHGGKINARSSGKYDVELGKRVRLRRVEMKISQSELADKLGVSFQQVQKCEKRRQPGWRCSLAASRHGARRPCDVFL